MYNQQDSWCSKELTSVELGDKRLNRRLLKVASDLLNNADEPIQSACGTWAKAKAAYRLFDNDKVQESALLRAHQSETIKRLEESKESVIFAIQDTTTVNYTHHPKKKGINKINKNPGFEKPSTGFFLHNTLLMTESGLPLGLLEQKIFQHHAGEKVAHKSRPITEKESFRWIESLRSTQSLSQEKTIVSIGDREADIYELFAEAAEIEVKILIRAAKDRILEGEEHETLWSCMKRSPIAGEHTIHIPARHNQKERFATLEVRYSEITLKPTHRSSKAKEKILHPIKMQAVWLHESEAPLDMEPLEWMLLTNLPVSSLEDAVRMSRWYALRWQIECYHRILKSGCKIEECRLETYERLQKYIRLKSIIAFRLFWLTMVNRTDPNASSDTILEEHEWKVLCCHIDKTRYPPKNPPTIREAVRMIAKLRGFLGRKGDGEPGMTYIWRGWEKLTLLAEFWLSTCSETTCG